MILSENLPEKVKVWLLKGEGLENFGENGKPDVIDFPGYTENDVIGRVDAVGICFSDVKLINAGNEHPRITGRNLKERPVIPGHEVTLTIVGVGEERKDDFKLGERYIVQADVYYGGKSIAYGYVLPGGYSEYTVIGRELLDGDEGCYLIPVKQTTGFAEAALVEPWACVVASYQIEQRNRPLTSGSMLVYSSEDSAARLDFKGLEKNKPAVVYHCALNGGNLKRLEAFCRENGIEPKTFSSLEELLEEPLESGVTFDDIVISGLPDEGEVKAIFQLVKNNGVISIHASIDTGKKAGLNKRLLIDAGAIHYRQVRVVGSHDGDIVKSYRANTRNRLKRGGKAWFVGGAGPMGQMHVIKAVMDSDGPSKVLISDLSDSRIESVVDRIGHLGGRREIAVETINPKNYEPEEFEEELNKRFPGGFDDVVVLVPVVPVIEQASRFVAPGGMMNVFAGVKIGTFVNIGVGLITGGHINILGSSGSPLKAMKKTLELVEAGRLSTNMSLAAVCDMDSVSEGIQAVMDGKYNGKIVVYPGAVSLGVKSVVELGELIPEMAGQLIDGKYWTNEAEKRFLESHFFKASSKSLESL